MAHPGIVIRLAKDSSGTAAAHVVPYQNQNYQDLKRQCLQQGHLFFDPEFKASIESLGYDKYGPGSPNTQGVVWKRPKVGEEQGVFLRCISCLNPLAHPKQSRLSE